jgi:pimeloyl-ACP methyl ester carboxylesterase
MFLCSEAQTKGSLWNVKGIHDTPKYRVISSDSVIGIIYEGLPYKNHSQSVFAYYSTPGIISGDKSKDKKSPAVVLAHGGGGAFPQWVSLWARTGYAAIAMDWRGNGPDGKHIENGFEEVNGNTPSKDEKNKIAISLSYDR